MKREVKKQVKNKSKIRLTRQQEKTSGYLRRFLLIALLVLVFYPPFFQGMFFEAEQVTAEIFVFVLFIVFWIYRRLRKDGTFLRSPMDYAGLALALVYLAAVLAAVGLRPAVQEWLKYCMFFAVFYMLSELANTDRSRTAVLWTIIASACGVSLLGIDGAAGGRISGILNNIFKAFGAQYDMFFDLFRNGRIFSTLQYPNTLAAYLMAAYFVSLGLLLLSKKLWAKALAGAAGFLLLITFIFTLSRGAYLILPFAALLFLILLPRRTRVRAAATAAAGLIASAAVSVVLARYISAPEGNGLKIWLLVIAGLAGSAGLTALAVKAADRLEKVSWRVYAAIAAAFVVTAGAGALYVFSATVPLELKRDAGQEDRSTSSTKSVVLKPGSEYRLVFEVDAEMLSEKPYSYTVSIRSLNEKNILFGGNTELASLSEGATEGPVSREVSFKVPEDSRIVDLVFTNTYEGTGAVFRNAALEEAQTGKHLRSVTLKYRYLPESIAGRLEGMFASNSTLTRLVYYRDGIKMLADRWLLGGGGGAWRLLYSSYQSYNYTSTQAHNYPLQLGIETGIIGLLAFLLLLAAIALAVLYLIKRRREGERSEGTLTAALAAAIAALVAHSFIDFDFSLAAVFLLFWELAALLNSLYKNKREEMPEAGTEKVFPPRISVAPVAAIAVTAVVLVFPVRFELARGYAESGIMAFNRQQTTEAFKHYEKALSADSLNPENLVNHAKLLAAKEGATPDVIEQSADQIRKAEGMSYHNADLLSQIVNYYLGIRDYENAARVAERVIELRPFNPVSWQDKVSACYEAVIYHSGQSDLDTVRDYIGKGLKIIDEATEVNRRNENPFIFNDKTMEMLEKLKYIEDKLKSEQLIQPSKVVFYNIPTMDIDGDGIPDQWIWSYNTSVNSRGDYITTERIGKDEWGIIQTKRLTLEAGVRYTIQITLENAEDINSIPFIITGLHDKAEQLISEEEVFDADFSVPENFNAEDNLLSLYITDKYIIKDVVMFKK